MEVSPSNQTSKANFSCIVHCSNTELITWFINGSPLPSGSIEFQRYPETSYCSQYHSMSNETHTLAIVASQTTSLSLAVYCAVVTVCNKGALNCSEHTCFSENAYFEGTGMCI